MVCRCLRQHKLMLTLEILKRELLNIKLQSEIRQEVENKVWLDAGILKRRGGGRAA